MFKRIVKTILNVLIFLTLVVVSYLTIFRGIFLETANAKTNNIDFNSLEKINNYSTADVHKALDGILKENDIPTDMIDEVLKKEENKEVIDNYVNEVTDAVKEGKELPGIPKQELENILNKEITEYNKKHDTNISLSKIKTLISDFEQKAEQLLKIANSGMKIINGLKIVLSNKLYYGMLAVTLVLILIHAIIFKKESIFSLGGISIFNGIALIIPYFILKISELQDILVMLPFQVAEMGNQFLTSGIIFIITGVVLLILYKIILVYQDKKKRTKKIA